MLAPSFGLRARDLENCSILVLVTVKPLPATMMHCCPFRPSSLIRAGTGANSGDRAKFRRCSTESSKGILAAAHASLFSGVNLVARALMHFTSCAVLLATSLAHCTKWRLATGFSHF